MIPLFVYWALFAPPTRSSLPEVPRVVTSNPPALVQSVLLETILWFAFFSPALNQPDIVSCFVVTYWSHLELLGVEKRAALDVFFTALPTGESTSEKPDVVPAAVIVSAFVVESAIVEPL